MPVLFFACFVGKPLGAHLQEVIYTSAVSIAMFRRVGNKKMNPVHSTYPPKDEDVGLEPT